MAVVAVRGLKTIYLKSGHGKISLCKLTGVLEFGPIITVCTPDPGNSENISGIINNYIPVCRLTWKLTTPLICHYSPCTLDN